MVFTHDNALWCSPHCDNLIGLAREGRYNLFDLPPERYIVGLNSNKEVICGNYAESVHDKFTVDIKFTAPAQTTEWDDVVTKEFKPSQYVESAPSKDIFIDADGVKSSYLSYIGMLDHDMKPLARIELFVYSDTKVIPSKSFLISSECYSINDRSIYKAKAILDWMLTGKPFCIKEGEVVTSIPQRDNRSLMRRLFGQSLTSYANTINHHLKAIA